MWLSEGILYSNDVHFFHSLQFASYRPFSSNRWSFQSSGKNLPQRRWENLATNYVCVYSSHLLRRLYLSAKLTVSVFIFFQIHGMRWLQRRQDLFCLPWLLLAAPSVTLISGQLKEPALAQSLDQRLHACRLKTITRNYGNQGPSIHRGELYRSVSKSLAKYFPSRLFLVCSTAILQLHRKKGGCLLTVLFNQLHYGIILGGRILTSANIANKKQFFGPEKLRGLSRKGPLKI